MENPPKAHPNRVIIFWRGGWQDVSLQEKAMIAGARPMFVHLFLGGSAKLRTSQPHGSVRSLCFVLANRRPTIRSIWLSPSGDRFPRLDLGHFLEARGAKRRERWVAEMGPERSNAKAGAGWFEACSVSTLEQMWSLAQQNHLILSCHADSRWLEHVSTRDSGRSPPRIWTPLYGEMSNSQIQMLLVLSTHSLE